MIRIGNHVRINSGVSFITHDGGAWVLRDLLDIPNHEQIDLFKGITVGNNVHIGTGTTIMPGVHIGNNVIIGCSAVVTKDIPDNSVAVGVPAKVIESIEEYVEKNKNRFEYTKGLPANEKKQYLLGKYGSR